MKQHNEMWDDTPDGMVTYCLDCGRENLDGGSIEGPCEPEGNPEQGS